MIPIGQFCFLVHSTALHSLLEYLNVYHHELPLYFLKHMPQTRLHFNNTMLTSFSAPVIMLSTDRFVYVKSFFGRAALFRNHR